MQILIAETRDVILTNLDKKKKKSQLKAAAEICGHRLQRLLASAEAAPAAFGPAVCQNRPLC